MNFYPAFQRSRFIFCLTLTAISFMTGTANGDEKRAKRPITLEDLYKVQRLGRPSMSPDGKWAAVTVTTSNLQENTSTTQLWMLSTDGKTQKQLTPQPAPKATGRQPASRFADGWQLQAWGWGAWVLLGILTAAVLIELRSSLRAPALFGLLLLTLTLASTDGRPQKQPVPGSVIGPVWSPDGKSIAFISKRDGDQQIWLISPESGEARPLSKLPMAPSALKWSADAKTVYCVVRNWPDTPDDESYRKKQKARQQNKVQALVIDDALYRVWDGWITDGQRPVVFAVDAANGKHKNLFAHTQRTLPASGASAADFDVSPDGKEICFTSETVKEIGRDHNMDLYVMALDPPGEPRNITTDNLADDFAPVYSPDGGSIAFSRQKTKFFAGEPIRIMLHERGSGKNREITPNLDLSCSSVHWHAAGDRLSFEVEEKGYHRLGQIGIEAGAVPSLTSSGFTDVAPSLSKDGQNMVFLRSNFSLPLTLQTMSLTGSTPQRIDKFNDALREQWDLGETKEVWFKGADDDDVQMWVVYPPNFDAGKKWPLLQIVHGGPHSSTTARFSTGWNLHLFASKGYVVADINFHGSSGFGRKFADSIAGDMATKPMIDIMNGTDWMESQPYIDKQRTICAGASYGGYMMAWLNGHTDRFKAMVCHAGVYNLDGMMATDFPGSWERQLGAFPFGDRTKIDKHNPQRSAGNFKTPTLVLHGEKDFRVPVTQAFEYYNTLRLKGVPSRLVYFPDENHWVLRPQNAKLWQREFFAWMEKHVGSGPTK